MKLIQTIKSENWLGWWFIKKQTNEKQQQQNKHRCALKVFPNCPELFSRGGICPNVPGTQPGARGFPLQRDAIGVFPGSIETLAETFPLKNVMISRAQSMQPRYIFPILLNKTNQKKKTFKSRHSIVSMIIILHDRKWKVKSKNKYSLIRYDVSRLICKSPWVNRRRFFFSHQVVL